MAIISFISALLTLVGLMTLFFNAFRHFKLIFFDCFNCFLLELYKNNNNSIIYPKRPDWNHAYNQSIDEYLYITNQKYINNSKYYADIFNKMKSHKIKVFIINLCKMNFAESIIIDGFEYNLHAFRLD